MKMNLRKKMGNFVVVLMLMFIVLSIPIGVYADNDDIASAPGIFFEPAIITTLPNVFL